MPKLKEMRFWVQTVLPLVYDDSLSYYEVLAKCVNYINNLIESNNETVASMTELEGYLDDIREMVEEAGITDVSEIKADVEELKTGKAPTNHRSADTTYGAGNATNYGHLKLYNGVDSTLTGANGTAATPASVKRAYDKCIFVSGNSGGAVNNSVMVDVENSLITENHRITNIDADDYSLINSPLSWTTSAGRVRVSGSCSGAVTLYITLMEV